MEWKDFLDQLPGTQAETLVSSTLPVPAPGFPSQVRGPWAGRMSAVLANLPQAGHLTVGYSTGSPVRLVWHGRQQHASSPSLEELVYLRKENNQHNSIISFKQNPNGKARQSSDVSAYLAAADQISSGSGVTATLSASTNAPNNQTSRKDW